MAERARAIEFGIFPSPAAKDLEGTIRRVRLAEELGLDLVGIQDHPYQRRFLDTFALLAHLAAVTSRIRLFPDVAHLPLRPPAMLAKQAVSLDVLSGGRFELGIGAGGFDQASQAMGAPVRSPRQKLAALDEAIDILRRFWATPERGISYDGEHYRLGGVKAGPPPAHDIAIWVGGAGPRMLELIGRRADGWVPSSPYVPAPELRDGRARIDRTAADAGRDPADIRTIYNVSGVIADGPTREWLQGPAEHWVSELSELAVDAGVGAFLFWSAEDSDEQLRAWAEVADAVRDEVPAARAG